MTRAVAETYAHLRTIGAARDHEARCGGRKFRARPVRKGTGHARPPKVDLWRTFGLESSGISEATHHELKLWGDVIRANNISAQ